MNIFPVIMGVLLLCFYKFIELANTAAGDLVEFEPKSRTYIIGWGAASFAAGIFFLIIGIVPVFSH